MNSEERDIINGNLPAPRTGVRPAPGRRIPNASSREAAQPALRPYAMAQLIYVQEEAIKSLNQQLEQARQQAQSQPSGGRRFPVEHLRWRPAVRTAAPDRSALGPAGWPGGYGGPQQGYGGPQQGYGQPGGYAPPQQAVPGAASRSSRPWRWLPGDKPCRWRRVRRRHVLGSALSNAFAGGHSQLGNAAAAGLVAAIPSSRTTISAAVSRISVPRSAAAMAASRMPRSEAAIRAAISVAILATAATTIGPELRASRHGYPILSSV